MDEGKKYDVVVVGELNVDLILNQIEKAPEVGKEVIAQQMTLTLGSSSAIFASNLSVLNPSVAFVGKLAHDDFGNHILHSLKAKAVKTEHIIYSNTHATGATIALNFNEDRSMITYPGAMKHLALADISDRALQSARHLHLSSIFLQDALKPDLVSLFKKAKQLGLTTSFDPQWDPSEKWDINLPELLPHVDVFLPNIKELLLLTRVGSITEAIQKIKSHINILVVKDGSNGAHLWHGEKNIHQPAFLNKNVVDSIGAGDSFNAGFIHFYLRKESLAKCLEFGALIGAVSTTRVGGTGAFENLNLVKEIAASNFNYKMQLVKIN